MSSDFTKVMSGLKRRDIHQEIIKIHHRPQDVRASDMSNFLYSLTNYQINKNINPPLFDFDRSINTLKIIDSTLYFFLRNCNRDEVLETIAPPFDEKEPQIRDREQLTTHTRATSSVFPKNEGDAITLLKSETDNPIIRFEDFKIINEEAEKQAEVFHPFIGRKTITKDDETLKNIMKNLINGEIEINVDKFTIMGLERDCALMILGFLYKKGRINFIEIAPNNLKIRLTDHGKKIKLPIE